MFDKCPGIFITWRHHKNARVILKREVKKKSVRFLDVQQQKKEANYLALNLSVILSTFLIKF